MASEIKYLSLEGLARVVGHIKLNFGKRLSYSPNTTNGTITLLNDAIDKDTSTYGVLATITIPSASTSEAGLMTSTQVAELNRLTSEEITGVTAGSGLTGGGTKGDITLNVGAGTGISVENDAVLLKVAATDEIGGIKIAAKRNSAISTTTGGTTASRYYGVELDNNNKAFVNVPWKDTTSISITATASDDDVVILTGTKGNNKVTYDAKHAKMFGADTPTTTNKYTTDSSTTSISGSGGSGTIKVPQLTVDEYGHVKSASDEIVTITMPTTPTALQNPTKLTLTVGNNAAIEYDGSTAKNVEISLEKLGIPNVMQYQGQTASTQTMPASSATITLTTGEYTAKRGDVVIDSNSSREYIWNGSLWELFGVDDISNYKTKQKTVSSPGASGNTVSFIDTISQDANGVITATKKTVSNASTTAAGIVKVGSNISVSNGTISVATAGANTLGVVKGWHRTSGTATGTRTTNATNSPSVNVRSTNNDRYYGVETDKTGAMFVNVPWINTTEFTISATANDDGVVNLTGTAGTNGVTYTASHAKQGPEGGFTGTSTSTSQSPGYSGTATLNIPKIDVNDYGHVTGITNQEVKITLPSHSHTDHTIKKGTETNCTLTITNSGSTSTIGVAVPTAAANALGVVKGWHRTSGTATGTQTTNATNSPSINNRTTSAGRYYGVETDSKGAMFVNVPWANDDTHYDAKNVIASSSSGTTAVTAATSNPYLNLVENKSLRSSIQIVGAGGTTVSGESGKLTITSETHVAITNGEIDALFPES